MFLDIPFVFDPKLQGLVLILNTFLLIMALIVLELAYIDQPKEKRTHLRLFYPFALICIGILVFAFIQQSGGG